ncbi:MAG TPA: hypothetical protein DEP23_12605, partial [Ruminococcaceae bacterium]|nr:hypothetical protein [Oscillospiraceae bacterium]
KKISKPKRIEIRTRHGKIPVDVYSPTQEDIERQINKHQKPPVHVIYHGGAYILQYLRDEASVARYLASELGCYVVIPGYTAAPQVQFPVGEEQCYDALKWVHENGNLFGWDTSRISVGGNSTGGKFCFDVALQAIDDNGFVPIAISSEIPSLDLSRSDSSRTSSKKRPLVNTWMINLVRNTYFKGADTSSPQASPVLHAKIGELPPVLIITAEHDTLRHEGNEFAEKLKSLGVQVTHKEFKDVDHGFMHFKATKAQAKEETALILRHLQKAYLKALSN